VSTPVFLKFGSILIFYKTGKISKRLLPEKEANLSKNVFFSLFLFKRAYGFNRAKLATEIQAVKSILIPQN
jgi:hypothetical protein